MMVLRSAGPLVLTVASAHAAPQMRRSFDAITVTCNRAAFNGGREIVTRRMLPGGEMRDGAGKRIAGIGAKAVTFLDKRLDAIDFDALADERELALPPSNRPPPPAAMLPHCRLTRRHGAMTHSVSVIHAPIHSADAIAVPRDPRYAEVDDVTDAILGD